MSENKQKTLLKLLNNCESIQNILDISAEFLGNPVNLFDTSYKMLAHSENRVIDDPLWNELIALGTFSHETVDFIKNEKFIDAYVAAPVALMKSPKLKYDRANGAIYNNEGIQIANACVVACYKAFAVDDLKLIETVCEALGKELSKNGYSRLFPSVFEDKFISNLIEGTAQKNSYEKEIKELNRGLKANIYIAVVDIIQYDNTLTHLLYFKNLFMRLKKDFQYYIYLNNIVILLSTDRPILNVETELKELNAFFSQYRLFAGVSSGFQRLIDLKKYFKEALNALNYGISLNSGKHIFSYDNFRFEHCLASIIDDINIEKLCHPLFFFIYDYDKKNKTDYLEILFSFLLSGFNESAAAQRMKRSNKDFVFCLNNAADIFEIDLKDGNSLFALFRSIRYFKCFPEKFPME